MKIVNFVSVDNLGRYTQGVFLGFFLCCLPLGMAAQSVIETKIPAEHETIEVKKVETPAQIRTVEVPAEYITIEKKRKVDGPKMSGWKEVCVEPLPIKPEPIPQVVEEKKTIAQIQEKLKEKGYYDGEVDNLMGPKTKKAITDFQRAHGITAHETLNGAFHDLLFNQ